MPHEPTFKKKNHINGKFGSQGARLPCTKHNKYEEIHKPFLKLKKKKEREIVLLVCHGTVFALKIDKGNK